MARLHRTARTLGMCFILLALLAGGVLFVGSRVLERRLLPEYTFSGVTVHLHKPTVSLFFTVKADSATVDSRDMRAVLVKPSLRLREWKGFRPSGVALSLRVDSLAVYVNPRDTASGEG